MQMEEALLQKQREGDGDVRVGEECLGLSKNLGVSIQEMKRLGYLAGPLVVASFSQYFLQVIALIMTGHLSELSLSSTAIAVSLCAVSGFSLLVISSFFFCTCLFCKFNLFDFDQIFLSSFCLALILPLFNLFFLVLVSLME